jgi:hypothetical protein
MHFHHHTFAVFPIGKDLYWYENTADMAYPPKVRTAGGYVVSGDIIERVDLFPQGGSDLVDGNFYGRDSVFVTAFDAWSDEIDSMGTPAREGAPICKPSLRSEVELGSINAAQMGGTPAMPGVGREATLIYSLATKRAVFAMAAYADGISVSVEPGRVNIKGQGCDTSVEIAK